MLIYLISDRSDESFFNYDLEIWEESKCYYNTEIEKKSSFNLREKVHLFRAKDMKQFQLSDFRVEFGKDNCKGHNAKSVPQFIKDKTTECCRNFKEVGQDIYLQCRSEIMEFSSEFFFNIK